MQVSEVLQLLLAVPSLARDVVLCPPPPPLCRCLRTVYVVVHLPLVVAVAAGELAAAAAIEMVVARQAGRIEAVSAFVADQKTIAVLVYDLDVCRLLAGGMRLPLANLELRWASSTLLLQR